jgi:hypothetical protein
MIYSTYWLVKKFSLLRIELVGNLCPGYRALINSFLWAYMKNIL